MEFYFKNKKQKKQKNDKTTIMALMAYKLSNLRTMLVFGLYSYEQNKVTSTI